MCFIKVPEFPTGKVTLAAISTSNQEIKRALEDQGVSLVGISNVNFLERPVCSHADMLCRPLGNNRILVARQCQSLCKTLQSYGFVVTQTENMLEKKYPKDSLLNAMQIGKYLICNKKAIDPGLQRHAVESGLSIVSVKQGYTRCSIVPVDEHSFITEDPSIRVAAEAVGIEVLPISTGNVILPGYQYGFLGGTCGYIGNKLLAFTGDIKRHPDYIAIKSFLSKRGVAFCCLTDGPLIDIGSIIPLKQMPKKYNRGFYLHGFNYYCYNCVCSVCTKRKCSYSKGWGAYQYRCKYCEQTNGELGRLLECDFFENKHTSMRRFRIARRIHKKAPVMETLEKIQEQLAEMNLKLDK